MNNPIEAEFHALAAELDPLTAYMAGAEHMWCVMQSVFVGIVERGDPESQKKFEAMRKEMNKWHKKLGIYIHDSLIGAESAILLGKNRPGGLSGCLRKFQKLRTAPSVAGSERLRSLSCLLGAN